MNGKISKKAVFSLLKNGEKISGEALAKQLGVSRQALHKQVQKLRGLGYDIPGMPKSGYFLKGRTELLLPEEFLPGLKTRKFGKNYVYLDLTDSTQNRAKELAEKGAPEGTLVLAEKQSAGRGRLGRRWVSPPGGLWASLILRPRVHPQAVPFLSLVASMAVHDAIRDAAGISCTLKWPNDVWVLSKSRSSSSQEPAFYRKAAGILLEMSAESEKVHWVVLGFGIDVNNTIPKNLSSLAISLKEASGSSLSRQWLLSLVLKNLETFYGKFLQGQISLLKLGYKKRSLFIGRDVALSVSGGRIHGKFLDIDLDGALILQKPDRRLKKVLAGEILSPDS